MSFRMSPSTSESYVSALSGSVKDHALLTVYNYGINISINLDPISFRLKKRILYNFESASEEPFFGESSNDPRNFVTPSNAQRFVFSFISILFPESVMDWLLSHTTPPTEEPSDKANAASYFENITKPALSQIGINLDHISADTFMSALPTTLTEGGNFEKFTSLLEDIILFLVGLIMATTHKQRFLAVVMFVKARLNGSISHFVVSRIMKAWKLIFDTMEPQSFLETLDTAEDILSKWSTIRDSALFVKLHKFYMYVLSSCLFEGLGFSYESLGYSNFEAKALKNANPTSSLSLAHCSLETIIFLCRSGHSFFILGDPSGFLHDNNSYTKLYAEFNWLKVRYKMLSSCSDITDFTEQEFVSRMNKAHDKLDSITKYNTSLKGTERALIVNMANQVSTMRLEICSKAAAQKGRTPPLVFLINGIPNTGKTTFSDTLFHVFGAIRGLPHEKEFFYTRNSKADFWDGFRGEQWCILFDDISWMNPNIASGGGDPSTMEIIQVINPVPYIPNQAAIEDKGRIPCRPELVLATTNTRHLNARFYFACEAALLRRFPYVVTPTVKPCFAGPGGILDSAKLPASSIYPDWWDITVHRVKLVVKPTKEIMTVDEIILKGVSMFEFQRWYATVIATHYKVKAAMVSSSKTVANITICQKCQTVSTICPCEKSALVVLPLSEVVVQAPTYEVLETHIVSPAHIPKPAPLSTPVPVPVLIPEPVPVPSVVVEEVVMETHEILEDSEVEQMFAEQTLKFAESKTKRVSFPQFFPAFSHNNSAATGESGPEAAPTERYEEDTRIAENTLLNGTFAPDGEDFYAEGLFSEEYVEFTKHPVVRYLSHAGWISYFIRTRRYKCLACYMVIFKVQEEDFLREFGSKVYNGIKEKTIAYGKPALAITFILAAATLLKCYVSNSDTLSYEAQGLSFGNVPVKAAMEHDNIYYQSEIPLEKLEVSVQSRTTGYDQFITKVERNTIYAICSSPDTKKGHKCRLLGIGGLNYITTAHSIPEGSFDMFLIRSPVNGGCSPNTKVLITPNQVFKDLDSDIAMIRFAALGPRTSLIPYFISKDFDYKGAGLLLLRKDDGSVERWPTQIDGEGVANFAETQITANGFNYVTKRNTASGTCGSVNIAKSPKGAVIMGIHSGGQTRFQAEGTEHGNFQCFMHRVTRDWIERAVAQIHTVDTLELNFNDPSTTDIKVFVKELHPKATPRFLAEGSAKIYGSLNLPRARPKSRVTESPLCADLLSRGYVKKFTAPVMDSWKPWRIALLSLTDPVNKINSSILKDVTDSYLNDILEILPVKELNYIEVYTDDVAINGADGITFVDKLKRSTSAGFPWKSSKSKLWTYTSDDDDRIQFGPDIMKSVRHIENTYKSGKQCGVIFDAHLKDEPVSFKKAEMGKTRLFTGAPVTYSIVVRKYLLSCVRVIQRNRFAFEAMPGTIAQSHEWGDIHRHITKYGTKRIVAGDYAAFDKRMCGEVILSAFEILISLCMTSGNYMADDILILRGIATDTAFPMVDFNGDLMGFYGGNPSGHPLTVVINSLANSIYMRYCYYHLNPNHEVRSFRHNVSLVTYGDDNILGTSQDWYNHTAISDFFATIDIKYTMADKDALSVPFIDISEASFLKRTWKYVDEVGDYTCPLDENSINKSLMVWLPSKTISPEVQIACIVLSASREYFFYGKTIFHEKRKFLNHLLEKHDLMPYLPTENRQLPTWDELVTSFQNAGRTFHVDPGSGQES